MVPLTSNLSFGLVTPIPTLPFGISTLDQLPSFIVSVEALVASSTEKFHAIFNLCGYGQVKVTSPQVSTPFAVSFHAN